MKIQIIGFGVIGQGFLRVLLKKKEELEMAGEDIKIVSITDISGTAYNDKGIDFEKALETVKNSGRIIDYPEARKISGLEAIEEIDADLVLDRLGDENDPAKVINDPDGSFKGQMLTVDYLIERYG